MRNLGMCREYVLNTDTKYYFGFFFSERWIYKMGYFVPFLKIHCDEIVGKYGLAAHMSAGNWSYASQAIQWQHCVYTTHAQIVSGFIK